MPQLLWGPLRICFTLLVLITVLVHSKRHKHQVTCKKKNNGTRGTFLWEIEGEPPSYFFGTIHVPYTRVWSRVPDNAKRAFYQSDSVFFELDLTDPKTISSLTECQMLPEGESLSNILSEDLFRRLKNHLTYVRSQMGSWVTQDQKRRGLHADYLFRAITGNWEQKRPVWVMLMVNALTKGDIRSRGVPVLDLYLTQEAERLKKSTGAVERVSEQCLPLNQLNYTQEIFALEHTLSQQERLIQAGLTEVPQSTDLLIEQYNCGNLDSVIFSKDSAQTTSLSIPHLGNSSLPPEEDTAAQELDDYFRKELILHRNERMARRVSSILKANPNQSFFFAFGAGHFLGNHTVLDEMVSRGHRLRQLSHDHRIKRRKRKRGSKGGFVPKLSILRNFSLPLKNIEPEDQIDPAFSKFLSENKHTIFVTYKKPAPTRAPKSPFNDLWVRIDNKTGSHRTHARQDDKEKIEESLRVWYGFPISSSTRPQVDLIFTLLLLFIYTVF